MNLIRIVAVFFLIFAGAQAQTKPAPKATATTATSDKKTAAPAGDLIDINHATAAELRALPGVGDAYSAAIVKRRPYKNKTQLRSMGVIPPAVYEKIKDKVIAKQ